MSKSAASIAVILALLTGLILGQLGSLSTQPGVFRSDQPSVEPQLLATARSFYDDMNLLLETGNRAFESTLAPGFAEHLPGGQADRTLPEMVDRLLATRAIWPNMHVTIVSLDQNDSMTVADLRIDPGVPRPIPGLPLTALEPMAVTEYLRIDRSGITDRWSANLNLPAATTVLQTELSWAPPSMTMPAIARIELEPGRTVEVPLDGPAIFQVESGTVQLSQSSNDLIGNEYSGIEPLRSGDVRVLETTDDVRARNVANEPAELWVFTQNIGSAPRPIQIVSSDPPVIKLFGFVPLVTSDQPTTQQISIARITLPPGTEIAPYEIGVMDAIAIVDGELDVTVVHGPAVFCTDGASAHPFDGVATFGAGTGISAKNPATLSYRITGPDPATLLIMRIDA